MNRKKPIYEYDDLGNIVKKECTNCGKLKLTDDYYKQKGKPGGVRSHCKECLSIKSKLYNVSNQDKNKQRTKVYYQQNKAAVLEKGREYRKKNPEVHKKAAQKYYNKNQEKLVQKAREYREKNNEKVSETIRRYREENRELIRERAKQRYWTEREKILEQKRTARLNNIEQYRKTGAKRMRKYRKENPEIWLSIYHRRKARKKSLIETITNDDIQQLMGLFQGCAISRERDTHLDHFIAISTGHGGTYVGNIVPLNRFLNQSKINKNPFEWSSVLDNTQFERFNYVVSYLASVNCLTEAEFRTFVYWCYDNQRSIEQVEFDNERYGCKVSSIELLREATGLHFPLPKYALNEIGNRSATESNDCLATV